MNFRLYSQALWTEKLLNPTFLEFLNVCNQFLEVKGTLELFNISRILFYYDILGSRNISGG